MYKPLIVKLAFIFDEIVQKFGNVRQAPKGHIFVDGRLMFNQNQEMIVDGA